MDHDEIYAMSKAAKSIAQVTVFLVLILALFISLFFARIILRPLEEMTIATEKVAAGDLTQHIDYRGHQDFQRLIRNFNIMTTNLRLHNEELQQLSLHDHLTKLANRRYFEQQLHLELDRAYRKGYHSTILLLDIDNFKKINDEFGHLAGDKALIEVAAEIKSLVREADLPVRFGGEEFLVLLPETSLEQGESVAKKIREKISKISIPTRKGEITVTISIGVACIEPDDFFEQDSLIKASDRLVKNADKALYQAKMKGKNRVEIYLSEPPAQPL